MRFPVSAMMLRAQSGILAEIVSHKRQEAAALGTRAATLEQQAHERKSRPRPFAEGARVGAHCYYRRNQESLAPAVVFWG